MEGLACSLGPSFYARWVHTGKASGMTPGAPSRWAGPPAPQEAGRGRGRGRGQRTVTPRTAPRLTLGHLLPLPSPDASGQTRTVLWPGLLWAPVPDSPGHPFSNSANPSPTPATKWPLRTDQCRPLKIYTIRWLAGRPQERSIHPVSSGKQAPCPLDLSLRRGAGSWERLQPRGPPQEPNSFPCKAPPPSFPPEESGVAGRPR